MDFLQQISYQCLTEQILLQTCKMIIILYLSSYIFINNPTFGSNSRKTLYIYYYYSYNYNELLLTLSLHFSDLHGMPKYSFAFVVNFLWLI